MMLSGGNAFDALAAGMFAAAVVEPTAAFSLASESAFMLFDAASGEVMSLSGQGGAPHRATVDFYLGQGLYAIPTGPGQQAPLSFTVPGAVHAAIAMLDRYGTKSMGEILAPAIQYAEEGVPRYPYMIKELRREPIARQFELFPPGGSGILYNAGILPTEGSLLVQESMARILKRLATAEAISATNRSQGLAAASDEFYRGGVAELILKSSQRVGGVLAYTDLAGFKSQFEEPLHTTFSGYEICGQRTWSQAAVLLQTLNMLERFDLRAMGHNTGAYVHTVTEALKLSMADRQAFYGDPDYAQVPVDGLLCKRYAVSRAALINPTKAAPGLPPAGDAWAFSKTPGNMVAPSKPEATEPSDYPTFTGDTTHLAVIDSQGNLACATPSGGALEKSVFFSELGCALSTRIEIFNLSEGHPNVVVPGKRPRTTLVSYLVLKDGVPFMTFGCPGGDHQTQANLQLMLNIFVFGMNLQEAVESPRFATDSVPNSFYPHDYFPGRLSVEPGLGGDAMDTLTRLGHDVVETAVCGEGAIITHRDLETGVLSAAADPRRPGYALSW
jgi:gamma-glutamyltranspeptidase/glutathione hydrolase